MKSSVASILAVSVVAVLLAQCPQTEAGRLSRILQAIQNTLENIEDALRDDHANVTHVAQQKELFDEQRPKRRKVPQNVGETGENNENDTDITRDANATANNNDTDVTSDADTTADNTEEHATISKRSIKLEKLVEKHSVYKRSNDKS